MPSLSTVSSSVTFYSMVLQWATVEPSNVRNILIGIGDMVAIILNVCKYKICVLYSKFVPKQQKHEEKSKDYNCIFIPLFESNM